MNARIRPPQQQPEISLEQTEERLIGGCLESPGLFWEFSRFIKPEHFSVQRLGKVWEAMAELGAAGKTIDRRLVAFAVKNDVASDEPMLSLLARCQGESDPTIVREDAELVHLCSRTRERASIMEMGARKLRQPGAYADVDNITTDVTGKLMSQSAAKNDALALGRVIGHVVDESLKKFDEPESEAGGMRTGIAGVDAVFGPLLPDNFYVIAGMSGMGKTSLLIQMIMGLEDWTQEREIGPGRFGSFEMSRKQVATRFITAETGLKAAKLRTGSFRQDDAERIFEFKSKAMKYRIPIDDMLNPKFEQFRTNAIAQRRTIGLSYILVDHLRLFGRKNDRVAEFEMIFEVTYGLKGLARELGVPIVALSQVNMDSFEKSRREWPSIDHLFGGQAIMQNADAVGIIHRPVEILRKKEPSSSDQEAHAKWSMDMDRIKEDAYFYNGKARDDVNGLRQKMRFSGQHMIFQDL